MIYTIINSVLIVLNAAVFVWGGALVVKWQNRNAESSRRSIKRYEEEAETAKKIIELEVENQVSFKMHRAIESKIENYYKNNNRILLKETISSLINKFTGYEEIQLLNKAVLQVLLEELNK